MIGSEYISIAILHTEQLKCSRTDCRHLRYLAQESNTDLNETPNLILFGAGLYADFGNNLFTLRVYRSDLYICSKMENSYNVAFSLQLSKNPKCTLLFF